MIKSMKPMETAGQLDAWMSRVTTSCAFDHLRREQRRRRREGRAAAERGRGETAPPAAPEAIESRLAWLRLELDRLDAETAAMARLRWGRGLTLARVGEVFGLAPGAVDGRLRRAAAEMRSRAGEVADE